MTEKRQNRGITDIFLYVPDKKKGITQDAGKILVATEAPQCKTYRVHLLRKVRTNTAVQLVVSLDRIEIEPLVPNKHAFWVCISENCKTKKIYRLQFLLPFLSQK